MEAGPGMEVGTEVAEVEEEAVAEEEEVEAVAVEETVQAMVADPDTAPDTVVEKEMMNCHERDEHEDFCFTR